MQETQSKGPHYEDRNCIINLFTEQSENSEILIGKISLTPKRQIPSQVLYIELKGYYYVRKQQQVQKNIQQSRQMSQYSLDSHQISQKQSYQNISLFTTNRQSKSTLPNEQMIESHKKMPINEQQFYSNSRKDQQAYTIECFLEGKQKISQIQAKQFFDEWQTFTYPFTFNLPPNLPPSINNISFDGHKIAIKYEIEVSNSEKCQELTIDTRFPIILREFKQNSNQINKIITAKFKCFKCCCICEGTYYFQFETSILVPGKLRVFIRVFKEGGPVKDIVKNVNVKFYGEITGSKKLKLGDKDVKINMNEFEMMEGQIIISYEKQLKSFENKLFTIRFWIEPKIEFIPSIWILSRNICTGDVTL